MTVKLFLADDHQIVRQGLSAILRARSDYELVGEAADGLETVRQVEKLKPDVLILDLMMPRLNGIEVARQVSQRSPRTTIVILSMSSDDAYVHEALRAGARGYVLKEAGFDELLKAIQETLAGRRYLSPPISEEALREYAERLGAADSPYESLTAREREVLQLTAEGLTGIEISERLFISPRTVETHRANLMRKLALRNQRELVRFATEKGLVTRRAVIDKLPQNP
jgi:DNA-binding NarL/FixJ family response regulator